MATLPRWHRTHSSARLSWSNRMQVRRCIENNLTCIKVAGRKRNYFFGHWGIKSSVAPALYAMQRVIYARQRILIILWGTYFYTTLLQPCHLVNKYNIQHTVSGCQSQGLVSEKTVLLHIGSLPLILSYPSASNVLRSAQVRIERFFAWLLLCAKGPIHPILLLFLTPLGTLQKKRWLSWSFCVSIAPSFT